MERAPGSGQHVHRSASPLQAICILVTVSKPSQMVIPTGVSYCNMTAHLLARAFIALDAFDPETSRFLKNDCCSDMFIKLS
jgi:hypothetical protein